MSSPPPKRKITIIGASISGLTLALCLLKHHNLPPSRIQILETRSQASKPGGPIVLAPNSLRILDGLDVESKLRAKGYSFERATYRDAGGNYKGDMPFGGERRWGYKALRIERAELVAVLKAEVEGLGARIEYDSSLQEILSEDPEGVEFRVRRGGKEHGNIITMRTNILIGCDGLHSKTRTFVLGNHVLEPVYNGTVMIAAQAQTSLLRYTGGFESANENLERALSVMTPRWGGIFMIPSDPRGEKMLFARQFPLRDRSREEWDTLDADKETLCQMIRSEMHEFPDLVRSAFEQARADAGTYLWAVRTLPPLSRWVSSGRRVVVVGDAAHTVVPAAGQGANQAVEDAWSLAQVLAGGGEVGLDGWQERRMEKVDKVAKLSRQLMNARLPVKELEGLAEGEVFDLRGTREGRDERFDWLYGG